MTLMRGGGAWRNRRQGDSKAILGLCKAEDGYVSGYGKKGA